MPTPETTGTEPAAHAGDERHAAHLLVQCDADLQRVLAPRPDPAARPLVLFMIQSLDEAAESLRLSRSTAARLIARAGELRAVLRRLPTVQDRVNRAA